MSVCMLKPLIGSRCVPHGSCYGHLA